MNKEETEKRVLWLAAPAVQFFSAQSSAREKVRQFFKEEMHGLLVAHAAAVGSVVAPLDRLSGKLWPDDLDINAQKRLQQISHLTAFFIQGIEPCEVAIAEGLYGQGAALARQHMEIIGAIEEVWSDKRASNRTPKVTGLPDSLRKHYGPLSQLVHASVPDYLYDIHTMKSGNLVGAAQSPVFNKTLSRYLYIIEISLILELSKHTAKALQQGYGEVLSDEQQKLADSALRLAIEFSKQ